MADERAETGSLSDVDPIYNGPNRYGSLQSHINASLLAQVAEDKLSVSLPCVWASDEAPKQITDFMPDFLCEPLANT